MTTQTERLKAHLDTGQPIHRLTALTDLGIFELSARMNALSKSGYAITRKPITIINRFGEKIRVVEYRSTANMPPKIKVDLHTRNQI
jgi:ABC-type antimicrobial peptide transport system ATPase subunit